ncbi:MAG: glucuronyl esterase domain-containing protein [Roseibacillus sp.]
MGLLSAQGKNEDEQKVPAYTLPALFSEDDGSTIKTVADWNERRSEILDLFAGDVYGRVPNKAKKVKLVGEEGTVIPDFLNGKATLREVALVAEGIQLNLLLVRPNHVSKPVPVILGLNFEGNHTIHSDPRISLTKSWVPASRQGHSENNQARDEGRGKHAGRWPIERIVEQGVAFATIYCGDIDPDFDDGFGNGVHAVFGKPAANEWGTLATWAWGLSRGLDYLSARSDIDGRDIGVFGFSRLGKAALWAGASDHRFAFVISNQSGCGGAALSRRAFGETVSRINTVFPHWFADSFLQYNDNEASLPVDQHQLLALIAPRPVYIASAVKDRWSDPKGEFLSAKFAEPAFLLFGKEGLGVEELPAVDQSVGKTIRYHIRSGGHGVTEYDWEQYLKFVKEE